MNTTRLNTHQTSAAEAGHARRKSNRKLKQDTDDAVDHEMQAIGIGIDTARYGHHVTFLREDKQPACPPMTVMETRVGYDQLQSQIERLHQRFPNARIYLRIDAAGQYAANLESFLRSLTNLQISISVGEPKRNKDYHSAHSPKRQSDTTESYAMARYAVVERPDESFGKPMQFEVLRRVAARLESQAKQSTRLINQLHETLSASFPELATLINDLAAAWVLILLQKYPTATRLAAARLSSIEKIRFIPKGMAEKLLAAAKHSVGTLSGDMAEALILELVGELQHSLTEEKRWRELLTNAFDALPDGPHKQIVTIKGIGRQTAAAILATAIDINRFDTDKQFIGYYGVFPTELQSGVDKFGRPIPPGKKIMCRKGNDMVRGLLWQCAKCASAANGGNPAVRALFARRLAAGDSAQVAWGYCMTKLLRQVYGVWTTNTPFDPEFETKTRSAGDSPVSAPDCSETHGTNTAVADEKAETSGPRPATHEESACEEVTEISASLELVVHSVPEPVEKPLPSEASASQTAQRRPIDYKVLRDLIPLQKVLQRIGRIPVTAAQHRGPCPIHEPNSTAGRKFSANLKRQVFRCFDPTCAVQGNVLDLWQAHTKLDIYQAAEDLAKTFGVPIPYLPYGSPKSPITRPKKI